MFWDNFVKLCNSRGKAPNVVATEIGIKSSGSVTGWKNGALPRQSVLIRIADYFNVSVSDLLGGSINISSPGVTEDYVTFPVIGEVAAGYDHIAYEDWTGDTIDVPRSWLKGHPKEDYFALRVCGDSMYPEYHNGDVVLVLRQETMNRSGEIGVVIYDDDIGTLKRVEYVDGEDWMKLSPINPGYPPITIRDERLEHCRVLGIPKYLVREIGD